MTSLRQRMLEDMQIRHLSSATQRAYVEHVSPPQQGRRRYHGRQSRTMSPQVSIDRDAVSAFCRRHHIERLALFGSVLRDDFRSESDIDVLVEFHPDHIPGFSFVSIEREFSGLVQNPRVDMVTPKGLNHRIRDHVLRTAQPLFLATEPQAGQHMS